MPKFTSGNNEQSLVLNGGPLRGFCRVSCAGGNDSCPVSLQWYRAQRFPRNNLFEIAPPVPQEDRARRNAKGRASAAVGMFLVSSISFQPCSVICSGRWCGLQDRERLKLLRTVPSLCGTAAIAMGYSRG